MIIFAVLSVGHAAVFWQKEATPKFFYFFYFFFGLRNHFSILEKIQNNFKYNQFFINEDCKRKQPTKLLILFWQKEAEDIVSAEGSKPHSFKAEGSKPHVSKEKEASHIIIVKDH